MVDVQLLSPELALVHANGADDLGQTGADGKPVPPGHGHVTFLTQRREGVWQIRLEQVTADQ